MSIDTNSQMRLRRGLTGALLGAVIGLAIGAVVPQFAYASTLETVTVTAQPMTPAALQAVQAQVQAAIKDADAKGLTGDARDAALMTSIAAIMVQAEIANGPGSAGEIASAILATTNISSADVGGALGRAASQMAANYFPPGKLTAQTVANEGDQVAIDWCAREADKAGNHTIARICEGEPIITGSTNTGGIPGAFVEPPPPAPCINPSCN
jgi:hypothetical protein